MVPAYDRPSGVVGSDSIHPEAGSAVIPVAAFAAATCPIQRCSTDGLIRGRLDYPRRMSRPGSGWPARRQVSVASGNTRIFSNGGW